MSTTPITPSTAQNARVRAAYTQPHGLNEEHPFAALSIDPETDVEAIDALQRAVDGNMLDPLEDARAGGVIGYINAHHSDRIAALLNVAASEQAHPAPAHPELVRVIDDVSKWLTGTGRALAEHVDMHCAKGNMAHRYTPDLEALICDVEAVRVGQRISDESARPTAADLCVALNDLWRTVEDHAENSGGRPSADLVNCPAMCRARQLTFASDDPSPSPLRPALEAAEGALSRCLDREPGNDGLAAVLNMVRAAIETDSARLEA